MSRRDFTTAGGTKVSLGWDPPLATFFLQVRRTRRPNLEYWGGTASGEIPDMEALERLLFEKGLSLDMLADSRGDGADGASLRAALEAERTGSGPPTPLQRAMAARVYDKP